MCGFGGEYEQPQKNPPQIRNNHSNFGARSFSCALNEHYQPPTSSNPCDTMKNAHPLCRRVWKREKWKKAMIKVCCTATVLRPHTCHHHYRHHHPRRPVISLRTRALAKCANDWFIQILPYDNWKINICQHHHDVEQTHAICIDAASEKLAIRAAGRTFDRKSRSSKMERKHLDIAGPWWLGRR